MKYEAMWNEFFKNILHLLRLIEKLKQDLKKISKTKNMNTSCQKYYLK